MKKIEEKQFGKSLRLIRVGLIGQFEDGKTYEIQFHNKLYKKLIDFLVLTAHKEGDLMRCEKELYLEINDNEITK